MGNNGDITYAKAEFLWFETLFVSIDKIFGLSSRTTNEQIKVVLTKGLSIWNHESIFATVASASYYTELKKVSPLLKSHIYAWARSRNSELTLILWKKSIELRHRTHHCTFYAWLTSDWSRITQQTNKSYFIQRYT